MRLAPALATALVLAASCGGKEPAGANRTAPPDATAEIYRSDPRIAALLEPCPAETQRFYDRDTSYMLPILVDKLEHGQLEPLRRAKEDIGSYGADAAEALRRLYDAHAASAYDAPVVENALDAAALDPDDGVREMLLAGIDHPQSSVRQKALVGLVRHIRPEDFDALLPHLGGAEPATMRRSFAKALFAADPVRAARLVAGWMGEGRHEELWLTLGPSLAATQDPGAVAALQGAWSGVGPAVRAYAAAPVARAGDAAALAFLRGELEQAEDRRKSAAIEACDAAGLVDELVTVLRGDPGATMRVLALQGIASAKPWSDEERSWIQEALDDPDALVRSLALRFLVEAEDPGATDRALSLLDGEPDEVQVGLDAVHDRVQHDVPLAQRVFQRLMTRHELESHRPITLRTTTYKAVGILPLEEAARFLRRMALEASDAQIEGLRAHRWMMIQASNTGVPGRTFLRDELAGEDDPLRRLDLLMAVASQRDDLARESLLTVAEGGAHSPYEVLYAAGRLVQIGPASEVAPRLKRVSYAVEDGGVRIALQCLLWTWY